MLTIPLFRIFICHLCGSYYMQSDTLVLLVLLPRPRKLTPEAPLSSPLFDYFINTFITYNAASSCNIMRYMRVVLTHFLVQQRKLSYVWKYRYMQEDEANSTLQRSAPLRLKSGAWHRSLVPATSRPPISRHRYLSHASRCGISG